VQLQAAWMADFQTKWLHLRCNSQLQLGIAKAS